jgi:hypothetical protein
LDNDNPVLNAIISARYEGYEFVDVPPWPLIKRGAVTAVVPD